MKLRIILFNIVLVLIFLEIASIFIIRSENLMNRLFDNTTEMWITFWQNKPTSTGDLYSTRYAYDDRLGWGLGCNLNAVYDNKSALFITNKDGIRSEKEHAYVPNDSTIRIAIIGDSYTEGAEVANHQTWPYYLAQELGENVEVLNFGVGGYGHDQCLVKLKRDVFKYHPDIVLLGFVNPDISRNVVAFRDFAKPMYDLKNGELYLKDSIIQPIEYYKKSYFLKSVALTNLILNNPKAKNWDEQVALCEHIIAEMNKDCLKNKVAFKAVYIPTPYELYEEFYIQNDIFNVLEKTTRENSIEVINTMPIFEEKIKNKVPLKTNGHWDAFGNELIGKSVSLQLNLEGAI